MYKRAGHCARAEKRQHVENNKTGRIGTPKTAKSHMVLGHACCARRPRQLFPLPYASRAIYLRPALGGPKSDFLDPRNLGILRGRTICDFCVFRKTGNGSHRMPRPAAPETTRRQAHTYVDVAFLALKTKNAKKRFFSRML